MDIDELPYVAARLQQTLPAGTEIKWIVIHDMEAPEGPLTAENVAKYFQSAEAKGSAHICVDNNSCVKCVPYNKGAAHAPGANTNGKGIELAGFARQTRAEWLDPYSLAVLDNGADCCAQLLHKFNLPNRFVDAAGLVRGERGWTTHNEVTKAFKKGTHWDPGPGFPQDHFQSRIDYFYNPPQPPTGDDDMAFGETERKQLEELHAFLVGADIPGFGAENPRAKSVTTRVRYLFGELLEGDNLGQTRTLLDDAVKNSRTIEQLSTKVDHVIEMMHEAEPPPPATP